MERAKFSSRAGLVAYSETACRLFNSAWFSAELLGKGCDYGLEALSIRVVESGELVAVDVEDAHDMSISRMEDRHDNL